MNNATKRTILRWTHLVVTIPILGYIYTPMQEAQDYAAPTRFVFVPIIILSCYWMYAGVIFAVIGVAAWIGFYLLAGYGGAVLSQIVLLIARKVWLTVRARRRKLAA